MIKHYCDFCGKQIDDDGFSVTIKYKGAINIPINIDGKSASFYDTNYFTNCQEKDICPDCYDKLAEMAKQIKAVKDENN